MTAGGQGHDGPKRYKYACAHVTQRLAYATPEKAAQAWNECVWRTR